MRDKPREEAISRAKSLALAILEPSEIAKVAEWWHPIHSQNQSNDCAVEGVEQPRFDGLVLLFKSLLVESQMAPIDAALLFDALKELAKENKCVHHDISSSYNDEWPVSTI